MNKNHQSSYTISPCPHAGCSEPQGLALITMDEGTSSATHVTEAVCAGLDVRTLKSVCRFDLGSNRELLVHLLSGHRAAVVVNTGHNSAAAGSISLMDVGTLLHKGRNGALLQKSGALVMAELQKIESSLQLPERIILFNVEIGNSEELGLSTNKKAGLSASLAVVVTAVMDSMGRSS